MRRTFLIILSFFIIITTTGILFMGARLFAAKEKVESLTEAQKSLGKRLELRDAIHELRDAVIDRSQGSQITALKSKTRAIIAECYGCHHSHEITMQIGDMEKRVDKFADKIRQEDSYYSREEVFVAVRQVVHFAESAYIKAKNLADTRTEYLTQELVTVKNAGVFITVSGLFLFLGFSFVAIKRVSKLESDVKERERVLQDWAEQWQRTFDSIQDMVFIMDKDCKISMLNDTAVKTCKQCAKGKSIDEALDDAVKKACQSVCREGVGKEITLGNNIFTVRSFRMHPDADEGGCVLVIRDITAEREMELRIIQSEKLAALGQVIAGVAHELNNPLSCIGGFSELLIQSATDDNARGMAEKINKSVTRAANIVQELLIFSRAPKLEKKPVNIKKMFSETLDLISEALNTSSINAVVGADDEITAGLDMAQMERVLLNLLTNAIHAIRDSGKGDRILLKAERFDDRLIIEVSDNGPGISQNVINRIFEPFFTTKKIGEGTGLGLSICYNIVKAHGGDIRVKSIEGQGTTFIIELPQMSFRA